MLLTTDNLVQKSTSLEVLLFVIFDPNIYAAEFRCDFFEALVRTSEKS
ncbi:hypothetical protein ACOMICROBIO_GDFFDHBD_01654 [Vibrio sp. B1REV9]|nr:hypothetical protein ACOMICROBIO_GDFFDHBD_01654 [Vibrio sp. B1REV9]